MDETLIGDNFIFIDGYYGAKGSALPDIAEYFASALPQYNISLSYFRIFINDEKVTQITFKMNIQVNPQTSFYIVFTFDISHYGQVSLTLPEATEGTNI